MYLFIKVRHIEICSSEMQKSLKAVFRILLFFILGHVSNLIKRLKEKYKRKVGI